MPARRFELVDDKSAKFWEITQEGAEYTVCFGKIGTKGQAKTKTLASQDAAISEVAKLIKEKTSKGYVEVGVGLSVELGVETGMPSTEKDLSSSNTKSSKAKNKVQSADMILSKRDDNEKATVLKKRILTKDIASKYLNKTAIDLSCYTEIDDDAAEVLSKYNGQKLILNGIKILSDSASQYLSKFKGFRIELNGLTSLTGTAASFIGKYKHNFICRRMSSPLDDLNESGTSHYGQLSLNGLSLISDSVADGLSKNKGDLRLNGVTTLTEKTARKLAKHKGNLYLNGITVLSENLAKELVKHKGTKLELNGVEDLPDNVAEILSQHKSSLHLNGLKSISDEAAHHISQHRGVLFLKGLITLSKSAEALLERHRHTARVISDIEVISQSFEYKDVNQSLATLRKKGVEKLIIKWDACNDDGCCQVIALANNITYNFDYNLDVDQFTKFYELDVECNNGGQIGIIELDLQHCKYRIYNDYVTSCADRLAEFLYFCRLNTIKTVSCLLELDGGYYHRDLTIGFAKFSMLIRKGKFKLVAKAQEADGNKMGTAIRKSVSWPESAILRAAGDDIDDDDDKFYFCFDPKDSSFNLTPQKTNEQTESIWDELRELFRRRIGSLDDGSDYCSNIIDQCGYPVQIMVDVAMGTFHYSGDYGELILNIGGALGYSERDLDIKYVEFASDPLTDFNCLANDYRIN